MKSTRGMRMDRLEGASRASRRLDQVSVEEPLEIRVQGSSLAVVMRTPGHDRELAAGFLLSEGIIRKAGDISVISRCEGSEENVVNVLLAKGVTFDEARLTRHFFSSSSCGLCGKASIQAIRQIFKPAAVPGPKVSRRVLFRLPGLLGRAQEAFLKTGGLHASALFSRTGRLLVLREDVGRHSALDKVIGHGLFKEWLPLDSHVVMLSGRVSFEMMQKALSAGISVVAAIGAPSTLAIEFAKENRQTLIGFLKHDRMNVYSHPRRLCP